MKLYSALVFVAFTFFSSDSFANNTLICDSTLEMGTEFKACVSTPEDKAINAKADLITAFRLITTINNWMSDWKPETELSRVNEFAGIRPAKVRKELFDLIKLTLEVAKETNGSLDPSFNVFWGLYNFKTGQEREPTEKEIEERLPLINYKKIVLDEKQQTIMLEQPGMKIGLGAIGQGYAVDKCTEFLKAKGYTAGFVDGSGDTKYWGNKPDGSLWKTGIRDPRNNSGNKNKMIAQIYLTDAAITTAGDDEKFFEKNGKRIHHILDPKTGRPADLMRQFTVIGKEATLTDAFDTACFVWGEAKCKKVLKSKKLEAIWITKTGAVGMTSGLIKKKHPEWGEYLTVKTDSPK